MPPRKNSNILIVAYNKLEQWQFRIVNKQGQIVQEKFNFSTPKEAEKSGSHWINNNLQDR